MCQVDGFKEMYLRSSQRSRLVKTLHIRLQKLHERIQTLNYKEHFGRHSSVAV